MSDLFYMYAKKLCEQLDEQEFVRFSDKGATISQSTTTIGYVKNDIGSIFYIVVISDIDDLGMENYDKIKAYYSNFCDENHERLGFSNYVILNLCVTSNPEFTINTESHVSGQLVYHIDWIVDINAKKLTIPKGQPTSLIGLNKVIEETLENFETALADSENTLTQEQLSDGQDLAIGSPLAEKQTPQETKQTTPIVTVILGVAILIIHLIVLSSGGQTLENLIAFGALTPTTAESIDQYFRIISSMFLHGGIAHLLFNCLMLYVFGSRIEKYFGHFIFFIIYAGAGIASGVATMLLFPSYSVGASGAIMGLCGASVVHSWFNKKSMDGFNFYMMLVFSIGILVSSSMFPNVNNTAHIAGLLTGALIAFLLGFAKKGKTF